MAEQKLLVKREGDFHYPIYFKNDFQLFFYIRFLQAYYLKESP